MSLYPLKISENTQESKIKDLKVAVDHALDNLSANFMVPSEGVKQIKSLTSNLMSVCINAYEKEKRNSSDLKHQFDQIQQEAVKEFNLRQNDFIKQLDLFENELKRLREENRKLFNQIDSVTFTFQKLKKSSSPIFSDLLQICNSKNLGKQSFSEISQKIFDLQELIQNLVPSDNIKDELSEVSESLPQIEYFENSYMNRPVRISQEVFEKVFNGKAESKVFARGKDEVEEGKGKLMFISDIGPRDVDTGRASISSLNYFLEDSYKSSLGAKGPSVLRENFKDLDLKSVLTVDLKAKVKESGKKEFLETFRTGSEVQIDNNDSFRTICQSPGENTVSTIFPALEDSPKYSKYKY